MTEKDILCEYGDYWVCKIKGLFVVMKNKLTHAESLCAFENYSLAHSYAKYKGNQGK